MPDNEHSSTGICPITASHGKSYMRTRIITKITLTSDKLTPIKGRFSIKDLVHQGPRLPTPRQIAHPGGFAPQKRKSKATSAYTMQQDGMTPIRMLCTLICQL
jgi:hypothetical protein